jgi:hypothetical protein
MKLRQAEKLFMGYCPIHMRQLPSNRTEPWNFMDMETFVVFKYHLTSFPLLMLKKITQAQTPICKNIPEETNKSDDVSLPHLSLLIWQYMRQLLVS